jgi:hypothetical protein
MTLLTATASSLAAMVKYCLLIFSVLTIQAVIHLSTCCAVERSSSEAHATRCRRYQRRMRRRCTPDRADTLDYCMKCQTLN